MTERRGTDTRLPASFVWSVLAASLVPQALQFTGVSLIPATTDGSLVHSLLEWSAVCASLFTAFLCFLYLRIRADYLVLTIALAALVSGLWDGLHALASLGLIPTATELLQFVPFTWAVSRTLKAMLLMTGAVVLIIINGPNRQPPSRPRLGAGWLIAAGVATALLASVFVGLSVRESLPFAYFPDAVLKRPWDLPSLVLIAVNGTILFPMLVRRRSDLLSRALWLSTVPDGLAAANMSFGSSSLYDHSFQSAHVLKLIACLVPFAAISLYFVRAFRGERRLVRELKTTEEELRAKEERLDQLTDNIREVFWISTADGSKMYYVSAAYEEIFGLSREHLYERPDAYLDVVHPEDRELLVTLMREEKEDDFTVEFRIVRDEDEPRWLRTRAFPIRNDAGDVYRLAGLTEDVTEPREVVEALGKGETRMRALLEAMPDLMFRLGRDGTILDYHARDGIDLYRRPEEFLGRRIQSVLPGIGDRIAAALTHTLDTGKMQVIEYRLNIRGMEKDFEARFVRST